MNKKIVLITGTSNGFGYLSTIDLVKKGFFVIATMRDLNKKVRLVEELSSLNLIDNVEILQLDITNYEQSKNVVNYIISKYGKIDILINNAGYSLSGFIEETPIQKWEEQFKTNFFGTVALTQYSLPFLKKNKEGKIINIGSMTGIIGFPGVAPYTSSKFALEGFTESLRLEMLPFNIEVYLIEPGAYKTDIWNKGIENIKVNSDSDYSLMSSKLLKEINSLTSNASNPKEVSNLITNICLSKQYKFRYPIGKGMKILFLLKRIIPWKYIELLMKWKLK